MPDPETGEPINVSHLIPRSKDDLQRRHRGLVRIAESTVGLMGRTPDYMNVTFAGFAGERGAWLGPDGRNEEGVANLQAFQRQLAREDICLTHTIVHPTIDRAKDTSFADNPVPLHKVADTEHGIVVRGGAHPRHAGAVRRRDRGVPRPPAAAGRHRPLRAQLLHPDGHAGPHLPVPRQRVHARRRSVRPAAVLPLRRAGRVRDLRRRRGARATGCSSTATWTSTTGSCCPPRGGRTSCSRPPSAR